MKRVLLVAVLALIGCGETEDLPECGGGCDYHGTDPAAACTEAGWAGNGYPGNGFCVIDSATGMRPISGRCKMTWCTGTVTYCEASPTQVGQCGRVVCTDTKCTELPQ